MARLGGWAWGLGRWFQGDHPPSTVVRWVQSWSRRILGVGVVWDCGGTSAGVGPLLGGKQGFYGVRGLVMQRELCMSSSAALQNPRRNKERTYPKPLHNRRCCVVVLGIEVGGRWSKEASNLIRTMADARAGSGPSLHTVRPPVGIISSLCLKVPQSNRPVPLNFHAVDNRSGTSNHRFLN